MKRPEPDRRAFLKAVGSGLGGAWLATYVPSIHGARLHAAEAVSTAQAFETLSADEGRVLRAVAARFFPTDDTPGADEAGVVYFMDRSLGSFWSWMLEPVQGGLAAMQERTTAEYPGAGDFSELTTDQQDAVLDWLSREPGPAFNLLGVLSRCGMFGSPALGGNRNKVGWELVGFEDRHVWQPPFGYYDRGHHGQEGDR